MYQEKLIPRQLQLKTNSKRPATSQNPIEVPVWEDQTSFDMHYRLLAIEFSKTKRNKTVAKELMKITYAMFAETTYWKMSILSIW